MPVYLYIFYKSGIEAAMDEKYYEYVECDKEGYLSQYSLCREKKVHLLMCIYLYIHLYTCVFIAVYE